MQPLRTIGLEAEATPELLLNCRPVLTPPRARIISADDIEVIRTTVRAFRQIDNRFGGGHIRSAVSAYLESEVRPVLTEDRYTRGTRRVFQLVSAELYQLAGWMAYDVGDGDAGRQHLRDALAIASDAHDDALGAEMLAAMSHHAAFSRQSGEAIDLAIAARRSAARSGVPALHAESFALEAQGLALRRDSRGCITALQRAERAFLAATPDNTPPWLRYFDNAYLSAKFAQALRDLGRPTDAERFARESLQMSDGYERGRLFNTALLASILLDENEVEEAIVHAQSAIEMTGRIRSSRALGYLRDVGDRLANFDKHTNVKPILREIASLSASTRHDNN